jgi:hypothetical protein
VLSCRTCPASHFPPPPDCPTSCDDRERNVEKEPDGEPRGSKEAIYESAEKTNQTRPDCGQCCDYTTLPDAFQGEASVPTHGTANTDSGNEAGKQGIAADIVIGGWLKLAPQDRSNDLRSRQASGANSGTSAKRAEAEGERVLDRFVAQMCRTRPSESSAASPIASDIVGWA